MRNTHNVQLICHSWASSIQRFLIHCTGMQKNHHEGVVITLTSIWRVVEKWVRALFCPSSSTNHGSAWRFSTAMDCVCRPEIPFELLGWSWIIYPLKSFVLFLGKENASECNSPASFVFSNTGNPFRTTFFIFSQSSPLVAVYDSPYGKKHQEQKLKLGWKCNVWWGRTFRQNCSKEQCWWRNWGVGQDWTSTLKIAIRLSQTLWLLTRFDIGEDNSKHGFLAPSC